MIIAVDGPAAAGKGTLAKRLAAHLGYVHLDTGKLYRAVTYKGLQQGLSVDAADAFAGLAPTLSPEDLHNPALLDDAIGQGASLVSQSQPVRAALLAYQRKVANTPPGAVLDGRDIGSVVCPEAPLKFFVTASPEARAQRRCAELESLGIPADYDAILSALKQRDHQDQTRPLAPLVPLPESIRIDTTTKNADDVFTEALGYVKRFKP